MEGVVGGCHGGAQNGAGAALKLRTDIANKAQSSFVCRREQGKEQEQEQEQV